MSQSNQKNLQHLFIEQLSSKGRGVSSDGRWEVIGALPGEEVSVVLGGKKKKKLQGYLREILKPSEERVSPRCAHVPDCGGCAVQQLSYRAQLEYKEKQIQQTFTDLIEDHHPEVRPIIGCETPWEYRNKMEFSFSENRMGDKFLGLMLAGGKGRVEDIQRCHLVSPWFSEVLSAVRTWWKQEGLRAYHHLSNEGHLRTMTVREAKQGKGKMVMLTVSGNPQFALKKGQMDRFVLAIKEVTEDPGLSIFLQVQQIAKGVPTQFYEMLLHGPDHITEVLHVMGQRMEYKISPTSFFQPNTIQAEKIFSEGISMLSDLANARVFDLYCGGATIGLCMAKKAKEVVGIELNPHSVFDAGWNKEVNRIENFSIHRGDVGEVLTKMREVEGFTPPEVVVIDPPRAGLDAKAIRHISGLAPSQILYISCNPKTQAENIREMAQSGYRLKVLQPVDQFPHTVHIENIALLQRS